MNIENDLKKIIKGNVLFDEITRSLYSTSACIYRIKPLAVIIPADDEDVSNAIKYAYKNGIPIIARGAGSGLTGQAIGEGIIIDFSVRMNKILEINHEENYVIVQPGVVLSDLNNALKKFNKFFPPDPSSADYCTIGGMIANNSSGSHAIKYGDTKDYIDSLNVVLSNGDEVNFGDFRPNRFLKPVRSLPTNLQSEIINNITKLIIENENLIRKYKPDVRKNCAGYNVFDTVKSSLSPLNKGEIQDSLTKLIAGSEGTLCVVTSAKLKVIDLPLYKKVFLLYFDEIEKAGESVNELLPLNPSAIEIFDKSLIELVRSNNQKYNKILPSNLDSILLVEYDGNDEDEINEKVNISKKNIIENKKLSCGIRIAETLQDRDELWAIRKTSLPLTYKLDKVKKPIAFIEDVVVNPVHLPHYIRFLRDTFQKYNVNHIIYGHAGDGNMHVRPFLSMKNSEDRKKIIEISNEVFNEVINLKGTISGEHGDGIIRAGFVKKMYGELYPVFVKIKQIFDPTNILNPGKIINSSILEKEILHNLRFDDKYETVHTYTKLDKEEYRYNIESCHGCGLCRSVCPVFKELLTEESSPRAKANLLREIISGKLEPSEYLYSKEFKKVIDTCFLCQNCLINCPTKIDIPMLVMEAKAVAGVKFASNDISNLVGNPELLGKIGCAISPLVNVINKNSIVKFLMEKTIGISTKRKLPEIKGSWQSAVGNSPFNSPLNNGRCRGVAYFHGCYAKYYDVDIGVAFRKLLEKNSIDIIIPNQKCCGIPMIANGISATENIRYNISSLSEIIKQGYDIVVTCPTCALALKKEYPKLWNTEESVLISQHTFEVCEYLLKLYNEGNLKTNFKENKLKATYKNPCHLKAIGEINEPIRLLQLIPGIEIKEINDSCCGMAGTFGMKKQNYELSMKIGERIFKQIKEANIDCIITTCGTCEMQLKQGTGIETKHIVEIL